MLTVKPTSPSSKDPGPSIPSSDMSDVIFMDEPPIPQEPIPTPEEYKIAKRTQGGSVISDDKSTEETTVSGDLDSKDISDDGNEDQVKESITENVLDDNNVDQEIEPIIDTDESINIPEQSLEEPNLKENNSTNHLENIATLLQENNKKTSIENDPTKPQSEKIVSQKHRPVESYHAATLQEDDVPEKKPEVVIQEKKKTTLKDLKQGFANFIHNGNASEKTSISKSSTLGNSLFFSSDGNADQDDIAGLKIVSYNRQAGQMYQSACYELHDLLRPILMRDGMPLKDSRAIVSIDRSGKITCTLDQSCGNSTIDNLHIQLIESIGSFPPIPKFIEAPHRICAYIPFEGMKMMPQRPRNY